jgi:hypothetical protein
MSKAYYSTVFDNTADEVWSMIRDFNEDRWSGEVSKSWSENGKSGQEVGNVRVIQVGDTRLRQELRAFSDVERFFTYGFCGTPSIPVENFLATMRVTPVVDGDHAFVEWIATFDSAEAERGRCIAYLTDGFARWLGALRKKLH